MIRYHQTAVPWRVPCVHDASRSATATVAHRRRRSQVGGSFFFRNGATAHASSSNPDNEQRKKQRELGAQREQPRNVTIIGGGMAGLGCLHALSPHARVTLVEAGRDLGGRVCTRTALGGMSWDFGASYFSCKMDDPTFAASPFAEMLRAAEDAGAAATWVGGDGVDDVVNTTIGTATSTAMHDEERGDVFVFDPSSFAPFPPSKQGLKHSRPSDSRPTRPLTAVPSLATSRTPRINRTYTHAPFEPPRFTNRLMHAHKPRTSYFATGNSRAYGKLGEKKNSWVCIKCM